MVKKKLIVFGSVVLFYLILLTFNFIENEFRNSCDAEINFLIIYIFKQYYYLWYRFKIERTCGKQ